MSDDSNIVELRKKKTLKVVRRVVSQTDSELDTETVSMMFGMVGYSASVTFSVQLTPKGQSLVHLKLADFGELQHLGIVLTELLSKEKVDIYSATSSHANIHDGHILRVTKFFNDESPSSYVVSLYNAMKVHVSEDQLKAIVRDIQHIEKNEKKIAQKAFDFNRGQELPTDRLLSGRLPTSEI